MSFREFLAFKNNKEIFNFLDFNKISKIKKNKISTIVAEKLKTNLEEYLLFGGHPKITELRSRELKIEELKDVYSSYIKKDIKDIGKIENTGAYNNLIQVLSSQAGNMVNIKELSNTLNINQITLNKYIFLLENTFVIYLLKPFFQNKRKEISKMPKSYFEDLGIRNMIVNDFRKTNLRNDIGAIAENFVFNELL